MTMFELNNLMASADIADLAGVTKSAVSNWKNRYQTFPEPVVVVARGSIELFSRPDVTRWLIMMGWLNDAPY